MSAFSRRRFIQAAAVGGAVSVAPFRALALQTAAAAEGAVGYGPLVDKGDLFLPGAFNYQIISRQGDVMNDGRPTPGIFDGMGAFPGTAGATTLIRNHENRERPGEQKVITDPALEYDPLAFGGNTKLEVVRTKTGEADPASGQPLYAYEVVNQFAILGGTSTNCAGGLAPPKKWITCEEVVKRSSNGIKHGYAFEVDSRSDVPVPACPILSAGRRAHEAAFWLDKALYMTEDRGLSADAVLGTIGACFYRWVPDRAGASDNLADVPGVLQAAKLRDEFHANMDAGRVVGRPHKIEWVVVDEPDHDDDTDNRRDRVPGFTPNRVAAQDKGAAYFDRLEGMWVDHGKVYFDATTGGPANLGQVWEYDQGRETLTLIYESTSSAMLENPDNVVLVPQTGDIFLQEDSPGDQFVRGVTQDGHIYDFARSGTRDNEFCGGCFDPDGQTFYLNQQGDRGDLPNGPTGAEAVTYAIYGPFAQRDGSRRRSFGNGPTR